ncbi:TetR/AcrR family transcriptional regulator [Solwaraspora sp. WMMD1047]|uniref:TetR/AcrR family transcriptional regulator n=1 Tax=Solwaraspora sp. WMMD1047 TaxID=3016102 RepID=UPI0024180837|nr:TetR/AcrR family transcriptional regulator [Solwaraspora sp. WMMD1047]MDG4830321.1 TetR/AcrR family transcriptional regulator [Solwaraspora sp. WMMD1047]
MEATIDVPRRTPRQLRSRDTVEVLLEAAAQVFQREGYAATTNRIADRAGVSIGSLYQYFPNKNAILHALAERHLADATETLTGLFAALRVEKPPLEPLLRRIIETVLALHARHPVTHRLLFERSPRTPGNLDRLARLEELLVGELADHLDRLDAGGPDRRLTARLLVTGVEAQLHRVLIDRSPEELPPAVGALVDLLTNGLARRPGGRRPDLAGRPP